MTTPRVAVIYSSPAEHDSMAQAGALLARFGVAYDESCLSPHRSPQALTAWLTDLETRGIEVVIAGSSGSAALAGIIAAHVAIPVVGVPLSGGAIHGSDALYGLTQLPSGVPVAAVGIDNALNGAVLAVQILAVGDPVLRQAIWQFKDDFEKAARL
ncbi:MAG: phosphoribosylaminoimidazole carboxylase, catalytic subunit [Frankiales bacterium]|nr:phosphoribosylaminoimidazole carboxylase, catalytic subunit [Frankiales bacterium]